MHPTRVALIAVALLTGVAWADASAKEVELPAFVDGTIFDQSPFDGLGDDPGVTEGIAAILSSAVIETRGAVEFDLAALGRNQSIQSAVLRVTPVGLGVPPERPAVIPVQVMAFFGDGAILPDDFNEGCFVSVFNGLGTPIGSPVEIDVTEFVRHARA